MNRPALIRAVATALIFIAALCFSSLTARAQDDGQPPPAQQQPTLNISRSSSLGEQIQQLGQQVSKLMPELTNEMMWLKGWIEYWSLIVMLVITLGSALREWHENNGEGRNLFWWFGRFAVCLMLWGSGVAIIDQLYGVGKTIAKGNDNIAADLSPNNIDRPAGVSGLYEFYWDQQNRFNHSYNKIMKGHLTVKVEGQNEFAVQPIDSTEKILGVMYDQGSTIKDIQNKLNDSSYSLPLMFGLMNFARGVMEFGDVWLEVLGGLLIMAFKLLAPLMIVFAIDRKLSQRAVHGYVWGLVVVTLFWPSVSYFLRALAYLAGNASMAVWDEDQVYAWNPATMAALRDPFAQPTVTIAFGALLMLGAGFALIISPYFAYAFSMGRVFEAVSQHATQTASSFVGLAAEAWSSLVGSHVSRHAETMQIEGGSASEAARAQGELDAAGLSIQGRQYRELAGVKAGQIERLGELYARQDNQIEGIHASLAQQKNSTFRQAEFEWRNQSALATREQKDMEANTIQQFEMMRGSALHGVISGAGSIGYMSRGAIPMPAGADGKSVPLPAGAGGAGAGAAGAAGAIGSAIGVTGQVAGPVVGLWWQKGALEEGHNKHMANLGEYHGAISQSKNIYVDESYKISEAYAGTMEGATRDYTQRAAGAISSGAAIQRDGINRNTEMESQAAGVRYDAQMQAANISRDAAIGATNMRAMGQVWSGMMSRVARDIEKNMEMRF